ncbi:restriction endonuclease [Actinosynnema sp. NPDC023587]|uniref:restriction endonuclease n=1 Tax=Actinosynnema sp. NPDC023587 TaxID=3154695 RepID=UPI0033D2E6AD
MTSTSVEVPIPPAYTLIWAVVRALRELGGSGRIEEINDRAIRLEGITEEQQRYDAGNGVPEIPYRLGWARSFAKNLGLIENVSRGVWALTKDGQEIDEQEIRRRRLARKRSRKRTADSATTEAEEPMSTEETWQTKALTAVRSMDPTAFERLCQRLLRQAGFVNVIVTGRSGDGGIDGVGVYRMSLVSFPVFFQCKRYAGTVGSSQVRDFRGAMIGRGEKGLLITTGSFTSGARAESTRDGAPPLDLIDGDELVELLREHRLGISTTERVVQDVSVDPDFFANI